MHKHPKSAGATARIVACLLATALCIVSKGHDNDYSCS
jgi:hypothetical protein